MGTKDCSSHQSHSPNSRKLIRSVIWSIIIALFIIPLIIWAIILPSKPSFVLEEATVFNFNVSDNPVNLLTSSYRITISSRNRNDMIGIYYDRFDVYASYRNQQVTLRTSIPSTFQRPEETNVWSPNVGGNSVPVSPDNALYLDRDQVSGQIMLVIHLDGRVWWPVGPLITRKHHLHVRCPAYINFLDSGSGGIVGKYTFATPCSVSF